jgi:hypothetical protein
MSIFEYNGSAIIAMVGKECVAIGSDLRFGVQLQTMTTDCKKVYQMHDRLFLGLGGLGTDAQTMYEKLVFRLNMYKLREERNIKPSTFGHLVSNVQYEKRFGPYFVSPVIAGLEPDNKPFVCGMDSIGAMETAKVGPRPPLHGARCARARMHAARRPSPAWQPPASRQCPPAARLRPQRNPTPPMLRTMLDQGVTARTCWACGACSRLQPCAPPTPDHPPPHPRLPPARRRHRRTSSSQAQTPSHCSACASQCGGQT